MHDVFLSYSHTDRAFAQWVADGLVREGLTVWWDQAISAGETFDEITAQALKDAAVIVVLWSKRSVESRWVRSEATLADREGKLIPVMIEPCDRPIQFELMNSPDLHAWNGDVADPRWRGIVVSIRRRLARPAVPATAVADRPGRARRALVIAVTLAAVLASTGVWWIATHRDDAKASAATAASSALRSEVSLAVLPFADLSAAQDQEYFSDGLTAEILDQLAQIPALTLVGRTSSFSFKGHDEDIRSIGTKLGVTNLLEGSVRKDGEQLRIAAQLVRASDGAQVWSRTYARELKDVFEVQQEIALDVARALSITLDVGTLSRAQGGTKNLEAHDRWLKLQKVIRSNDFRPDAIRRVIQLSREAVALDPQFALAWDALGTALDVLALRSDGEPAASIAQMRAEAVQARTRAATLAPHSWVAKRQQVDVLMNAENWAEAEAIATEILKSEPWAAHDVDRAYPLINVLFSTGRLDATIALVDQVQKREPLAMFVSRDQQFNYYAAARFEEAEAEYQRSRTLEGNHAPADELAWVRSLRGTGDLARTRAAYLRAIQSLPESHWLRTLEPVVHDRERLRAAVRAQHARDPESINRYMVAAAVGELDVAFEELRNTLFENASPLRFFELWVTPYPEFRSDPRFAQILREVGLADYWRRSGNWPDACHATGVDSFACR